MLIYIYALIISFAGFIQTGVYHTRRKRFTWDNQALKNHNIGQNKVIADLRKELAFQAKMNDNQAVALKHRDKVIERLKGYNAKT